MMHLVKVRSHYYYNRRVPESVRQWDKRINIRVSLKTDSKVVARQRASVFNERVEAYWQDLMSKQSPHDTGQFSRLTNIARQMGFSYQPMSVVAAMPIVELVERILLLKDAKLLEIEAALGAKPLPVLTIKDALDKYWSFSRDKILNKSQDQVRKWKNPRIKAVNNFIKAVGNKIVTEINRDDILVFKDWWLKRVTKDNMNSDTANKDFIHLKVILEAVSDNMKLSLDIAGLFRKIKIKSRHKRKRPPFSNEQVKVILNSPKLEQLSPEEKWLIFAAAGTGARPSELVGLLPCDIHLDVAIPFISIKDRKERELKTPHSERDIPLTGPALEAFRNMPGGFQKYRDRTDHLTNAINKSLREYGLLPTEKHTLYSFRHSFQDRLLAVDAPDRVQAELMGHKFNRPEYGDGPTLEQKLRWMEKALLK